MTSSPAGAKRSRSRRLMLSRARRSSCAHLGRRFSHRRDAWLAPPPRYRSSPRTPGRMRNRSRAPQRSGRRSTASTRPRPLSCSRLLQRRSRPWSCSAMPLHHLPPSSRAMARARDCVGRAPSPFWKRRLLGGWRRLQPLLRRRVHRRLPRTWHCCASMPWRWHSRRARGPMRPSLPQFKASSRRCTGPSAQISRPELLMRPAGTVPMRISWQRSRRPLSLSRSRCKRRRPRRQRQRLCWQRLRRPTTTPRSS
mmetsp:Transcript_22465/g.47992  ORF Transcript_22465/g.47992 Transcript_22465/m.47992 type:complete len:253 (+) Transcript_22465:2-760(+)